MSRKRKRRTRQQKPQRVAAPVQGMMATMPEVQTALNTFYDSWKSFGELMFSLNLDAYQSKHDMDAYTVYRWVGLMASNIRNSIERFKGHQYDKATWDVGITDEDRANLNDDDDDNDMLNKVSKYDSGVITDEKWFKEHVGVLYFTLKSFGDLIDIYTDDREEHPADIHLLNMLTSMSQISDAVILAEKNKAGNSFELVDNNDTSREAS